MKTVRMLIEVDIDDIVMGESEEEKNWFFGSVLATGDLILHSNEIGDTVGEVRVLEYKEL